MRRRQRKYSLFYLPRVPNILRPLSRTAHPENACCSPANTHLCSVRWWPPAAGPTPSGGMPQGEGAGPALTTFAVAPRRPGACFARVGGGALQLRKARARRRTVRGLGPPCYCQLSQEIKPPSGVCVRESGGRGLGLCKRTHWRTGPTAGGAKRAWRGANARCLARRPARARAR